MKKIAIFGGGGFGREVKMLIDQINGVNHEYELIGYFDDGLPIGSTIGKYSVLGGINELNNFPEEIYLVFSIAKPQVKVKLLKLINNDKVKYPKLIHPSCFIGEDNVNIGEGTIICAGTLITVDINIGKHVILNLGCTIGHDTVIGSFSSFMPSVNISGEVVIGESVYCGTGAKIINQLEIGNETIIGAGAVVSKTLPPYCTAVGIPAKPIKFHNE